MNDIAKLTVQPAATRATGITRPAAILLLSALAVFLGFALLSGNHPGNLPSAAPASAQVPAEPARAIDFPSSPNLLLGNPSRATADTSNRDNYLMIKPFYALSYNSSKGIPNWVSWRVTSADLGTAARKREFDTDLTLPDGFVQVTHKDYTASGFDRGHMCPHGDRTANLQMSYATFVMTNIIPQAPNVNRKAWDQLEVYSRELVRKRNRVYIVSGPFGKGGVGSNGPLDTLANGKVTVPAECWKVIVAIPEAGGDDDLAKITPATRVIAVDMPNDQTKVGEEWAGFRVAPQEIEAKTGLHFFTAVREDIAAALRAKADKTNISPPVTIQHTGD
jgi:endonuclease G, mitochondrial